MTDPTFIDVEVEAGASSESDLCLRFKRAGQTTHVSRLEFEREDGVSGWWSITSHPGAGPVQMTAVEDSSEGTVLLFVGGTQGLALVHEQLPITHYEPYLVLTTRTRFT